MKIIKHYTKIIFLLASVFFLWDLIVLYLFDVPANSDEERVMVIIYAIAGTILTVYLYRKRK